MFDNIDWGTTIISAIISGIVAIGVAWYFRFKVKPKFEIVFDDNRQANLRLIFNGLQWFDSEFQSIYEIFERELGELKKEREEIIPRPKFIQEKGSEINENVIDLGSMMKMDKIFAEVRDNLNPILARMLEQQKTFLRDYHIFLNYLHDSFLREINNYYFTTIYYTKWVLKGNNFYSIGIKRKEHANRIIKYLEEDKTINKTEKSLGEFISKWKNQ